MKKNKRTPFWRISGAQLNGISYLLGTMHVKPLGKKHNWQERYINYIDLCEIFATEIPLDKIDVTLLGKSSQLEDCLLYTSPSPRDATLSRMPSSA